MPELVDAIVTGAAGFIGSALATRLEQDGKSVLRLTRASGDIAKPETWQNLPDTKTIYHLAGSSYVPNSWKEPEHFIHTNVVGTQQALNYCKASGAALVFASAYIYGIPKHLPIAEDATVRPNNPYALSKYLAEQCCSFMANYKNVPVTILRTFNVYGPRQRPEFLIPLILNNVLRRESIRVLDLDPRRDYVYLDDVVDAFVKAAETTVGLRTINIGSGKSHSVQGIIDIIQRVACSDLAVHSSKEARPNEIPDVVADISLARQLLDWAPRHRLEDGIQKILHRMATA